MPAKTTTDDMPAAQARRLALAAQGFGRRRPAKPRRADLRQVARRLHAVQIDSVNTLVRAHYLPFFSRLGPYDRGVLDHLINGARELVELDAHQASFVPVELEPLVRWQAEERARWRAGWRERLARRPGYIEVVEQQVRERGPLRLADLDDPGRRPKLRPDQLHVRRRDGKPYAESSLLWGRPSDGRDALDGLAVDGRLALAGRGPAFERLYDLAERVYPDTVRAIPTPSDEDAFRALVRRAATALGVSTVADLANYFMLKKGQAAAAVRDLVAAGDLRPVRVDGWTEQAYLDASATAPRRIDACALLGPFDSLTWSRERTRRIFGFEFSFEIYVPAAKRRYGYYVLPFLLGDALVARVDLKADRARSTLLVLGAFIEDGTDPAEVAPRLSDELRTLASWLGLQDVEVGRRGGLAAHLAKRARQP